MHCHPPRLPSFLVFLLSPRAGPKKVYHSEAVQKSRFRQCLEKEGEEEEEEAAGSSASAQEQEGNQTESAALALEGEVRYWTDYLKAHLHPSTVTEIAPDWIEREDGGSSASYGEGRCLVGGEEAAEERREGLRQAVEACDHLQVKRRRRSRRQELHSNFTMLHSSASASRP